MKEVVVEVELGGKLRTITFGEKAMSTYLSQLMSSTYTNAEDMVCDFVYLGLDNDYYKKGLNVDFTLSDVRSWVKAMPDMDRYLFAVNAVPKLLACTQEGLSALGKGDNISLN